RRALPRHRAPAARRPRAGGRAAARAAWRRSTPGVGWSEPKGASVTTIGILHPGEMGSAVGAAARAGGARVIWASAGRGPATRKRADADGLEDVDTLARLARESEIKIGRAHV